MCTCIHVWFVTFIPNYTVKHRPRHVLVLMDAVRSFDVRCVPTSGMTMNDMVMTVSTMFTQNSQRRKVKYDDTTVPN